MRNSGGVGDRVEEATQRSGGTLSLSLDVFNFLFFVVICIFLLNIILGTIIDTFCELREQNERLAEDKRNLCFICGINKETFDRNSKDRVSGFTSHVSNDHRIWSYLQYLVHIWEQPQKEDDGVEHYIRSLIENGDTSWFPVGRALKLEWQSDDKEADIASVLKLMGARLKRIELGLDGTREADTRGLYDRGSKAIRAPVQR